MMITGVTSWPPLSSFPKIWEWDNSSSVLEAPTSSVVTTQYPRRLVSKQHSIHSKLTNHQSLQLSFLQRALHQQRSVITADSLWQMARIVSLMTRSVSVLWPWDPGGMSPATGQCDAAAAAVATLQSVFLVCCTMNNFWRNYWGETNSVSSFGELTPSEERVNHSLLISDSFLLHQRNEESLSSEVLYAAAYPTKLQFTYYCTAQISRCSCSIAETKMFCVLCLSVCLLFCFDSDRTAALAVWCSICLLAGDWGGGVFRKSHVINEFDSSRLNIQYSIFPCPDPCLFSLLFVPCYQVNWVCRLLLSALIISTITNSSD